MKHLSTLFSASVCMLAGLAAQADDAASVRVALDIERQPVRAALKQFSDQAGVQVLLRVDNVSVDAVISPKINGEVTLQSALEQLLKDTGLKHEFVNDRAVRISAAGADEPSSGAAKEASKSLWKTLRLAQLEATDINRNSEDGAAADDSAFTEMMLEEVIVTAQKRKEQLHEVPISISVLGGRDLDRSTFTGALEALKTVPGVALLPNGGTGGGTMLNIRGVGAADAVFNGSSPVGYYLDSVPFSLIRDAIVPDQNSFDLQQIEVLRGPQGTLYGASSVNGLVRVLTNDADPSRFEFKARTTVASTHGADDLSYRADGAVNIPLIEGKLAVRAVVGYDFGAGWIDSFTRENINDTRARNYRFKIRAQPTDAFSIGVAAWVNNADIDARPISNEDGFNGATLAEPSTEDFDAYSLTLGYEFAAFSLQSATSYLDYEGTGTIDSGSLGLPAALVFTSVPAESFSQEIILNSAQGSAWKWTVGAFYHDVDSGLLQTWQFFTNPISFSDDSESVAVFGQLGRRFWNERLEWTLGVRYFEDDIHHELSEISIPAGGSPYERSGKYTATTPRAVLTWYPSDSTTIYGSYAQGFRSGLPLSYTVGLTQPDFRDAEPDKLHNYEVGAKVEMLGGRLLLDAAIYYIQWDDVQQSIGVPFNGTTVTAVVNGESASGVGLDFAVTARPAEGLELGLSGGWNDLAIDADVYVNATRTRQLFAKGDRLNRSPEITTGAFINYNRPLGSSGYRGGFSISANYVSEMNTRAAGTPRALILSGDDLVFGQASFVLEAPTGWSSKLFVDNFTDEYGAFTSVASGSTVRLSRPRPRTYGVQLDYRF